MSTGVLDKWSCGGSPGDSTGQVAVRTLKDRLGTVREAFARAAAAAEDDGEAVHALRVAARRAEAAIRLYADWLPARQAARWKKRLKRIRRVAGTARDADVLARRLAEKGDLPGIGDVLEGVQRDRRKARKPIRHLYRESENRDWFGPRLKRLLRRISQHDEWEDARFETWAETQLSRTVSRFFRAEPTDDEVRTLHRFRLRAKELRYTLELVAGAFPPDAAEDAYRSVDALQRDLGDINDRTTGLLVLRDRLRSTEDPDTFDILRGYYVREKAQLDRARADFLHAWKSERSETLRGRLEPFLVVETEALLSPARLA